MTKHWLRLRQRRNAAGGGAIVNTRQLDWLLFGIVLKSMSLKVVGSGEYQNSNSRSSWFSASFVNEVWFEKCFIFRRFWILCFLFNIFFVLIRLCMFISVSVCCVFCCFFCFGSFCICLFQFLFVCLFVCLFFVCFSFFLFVFVFYWKKNIVITFSP